MDNVSRSDVLDRLEGESISTVVEWLKKGIRKDPYWSEGHRWLGDLYFTKLDHNRYALMEYRKLMESRDDPSSEDRLRLALSYREGDYEEKASRQVEKLDFDELPETVKLLDTEYNTDSLRDRLTREQQELREEHGDEWFDRQRREGREYLKSGQLREAEKHFEQALEYRDDPDTRLKLARCQLGRRNYPEAVENLKSVLADRPDSEQAQAQLEKAYRRLGLKPDNNRPDDSDSPGQHRRAG